MDKESFLSRCKRQENGCLYWIGGHDGRGYGVVSLGYRGSSVKAHRLAYELFISKIPEGLSVLHSCDTPTCVEPSHLFVGTQLDNVRDMDAKGRRISISSGHNQNTFKNVCIHGHRLTPDNIYICPRGKRLCKTCNRERTRAYYAKQKQVSS